jgi:hypothetical protein
LYFTLDSESEEEEESPANFECKKCKKLFKDLAEFRLHGESVHKEAIAKLHTCLICNANFFNTSSLKRHQEVVHAKIKKFDCKVCLKTFALKQDLVLFLFQLMQIQTFFYS